MRAYIALLSATLVGLLIGAAFAGDWHHTSTLEWVAFAVLFALFEKSDLLFYYKSGQQSVAPGEAVLLPMFFALPPSAVVWSVTLGVALVAVISWRLKGQKLMFNIAQYGCSAAAAAGVWALLHDGSASSFTVVNASVAVLSVAVFAASSHVLTVLAVSLAEGRRLTELSKEIAPATGLTFTSSVAVGLFFAGSYVAASWTIILFPLALGALQMGSKALIRQAAEHERVEYLHDATRALASSPDVHHAIVGFLRAVSDVVSAAEARLIISSQRGWRLSCVRNGEAVSVEDSVSETDAAIVKSVQESSKPISTSGLHDQTPSSLRLDARSFVAVPLFNEGEVVGSLVAIDRLGADDFDDGDIRLMQALADEFAVALDSYRLFEEVAEERERFHRIFEGSKEGICLLDNSGIVRAWNPALERISGYDARELGGRVWSEKVLVRDDQQRRIEGLDLVGRGADEELELVTRDGPTRWISVIAGPVESGKERGWVVLVRDRTAEHAVEEAKSDFISTISHELRTPLTTIKGSLQVLARRSDEVPENMRAQMIDVMHRGADRLERLVLSLLTVSQMETGELAIIPEDVRLDHMIEDAIRRVLRDHPDVDLHISDRPVRVRGDREKLGQTIDALLDNARKYGGIHNPIRIELARHGGFARLSVSDRGPGIPKAEHGRVFERFVRLGDMNTREAQGAGVGLFIAKRAIEAMGGEISIDSADGGGATFHVTIPLAHPVAVADSAQTG